MPRPSPQGWTLPKRCEACQWRCGDNGDFCLLYNLSIWRAWRSVHGCDVHEGEGTNPNPLLEAQAARWKTRLKEST